MQKNFLSPTKLGLKAVAFGLLLVTGLYACKKNKGNNTTPEPVPTTTEKYQALVNSGLQSLMQNATFDASNTSYVYTSPKGTQVFIDGSCLRKNGAAVTGQVKLDFYEGYERADMVIANKTTMGFNANNILEPLQTGGQFYVNVSQDGVDLTSTCNVKILTDISNTGDFEPDMVGWLGVFQKADLVWQTDPNVNLNGQQERSYELDIPGFGWFNIDMLYNDPRPKVTLNIQVPAAYVDASNVYAIIKGEPYSLGLANYGQWPVGLEIYTIFVTEDNGQYRWATQEITVANNQVITFNIASTTVGTMAQLTAHLATLD